MGLYKLNPFVSWSFAQVKAYIDEYNVPRNALLAQGYKSVGDWHSTQKSGDGEAGERAGRWQGKEKTECGLHKDYFKMKLAAKKKVSHLDAEFKDPNQWLTKSNRLEKMNCNNVMKLGPEACLLKLRSRMVQPLALLSYILSLPNILP